MVNLMNGDAAMGLMEAEKARAIKARKDADTTNTWKPHSDDDTKLDNYVRYKRLQTLRAYDGEPDGLVILSAHFDPARRKTDFEIRSEQRRMARNEDHREIKTMTWAKIVFTLMAIRGGRKVHINKYSQGSAHLSPPKFGDIVYSLVSDVSGIEDQTFQSWCADYGYNDDSISDRAIFDACRDTLPRLRKLLGAETQAVRDMEEEVLFAHFKDVVTFRATADSMKLLHGWINDRL